MALVISPENNVFLRKLKEEGKIEGIKASILKLYSKKKLTPEEIAEILEVPLDLVREAIEEGNSSK